MATTDLDPARTAVLVMDMQPPFLQQCLDADMLIANINNLLTSARNAKVLIAFVRVAFRPGYPELADASPLAAIAKPSGMLIDGGEDTQIDARIDRADTDLLVTKHRTSAFSGNDLEMILRSRQLDTLVLSGFSTAGVVLSTLDAAFDLDYRVVVCGDCCSDPDPGLQDVLINKLFARKATVAAADDIAWHV